MYMTSYPFVACSKCHAEVSTDRESCPHCGEVLPEPSDVVKLRADNARLKTAVEAEMAALNQENAALRARLANPKAAN
jgi:regulator of replication initiation timing